MYRRIFGGDGSSGAATCLPVLLVAAVLVGAMPVAAQPAETAALAPMVAATEPSRPGASSAVAGWDSALKPVTIVTNEWADVREILRSVAASAGLGLQLAPDVKGTVNVHLENIAVGRALAALCDPVDLGWEVVEGDLIIYRRGMVTRWFTFDYPVTQREGRGELQISATRQSDSGASAGGENQNKSHVTSTATMTVWPEVMKSLLTVVFPVTGEVAGAVSGDGQEQALSHSDAEGRCLVVNPMASLVQVTAEWDRVQRVEHLLERLKESLQRQVAVEVRIMEISLDENTQTGINWQTYLDGDVQFGQNTLGSPPALDSGFVQMVVDTRHLMGVVQALSTSGRLHTVSSPRVTTLNNQKAIVRIVREDVYFLATVQPAVISNGVATEPVISYYPQTVPVGVVLDVTPQVGHDRVVTLNVHPTISDVVAVAKSPNLDSAPVLSVRELDTVGKIGDGQTMVIAGLLSERVRLVRTGVPILKDLPFLGLLFSHTTSETYNVELVMMLTPTIMDDALAGRMARDAQTSLEARR
jgi:type II secretory pathway component GspD/PulD (secretin)